MMNYEDFASEFEKALGAEMPGLTLRRQTVSKASGLRDGIAVMFSESGFAPLIYLDDMYEGWLIHLTKLLVEEYTRSESLRKLDKVTSTIVAGQRNCRNFLKNSWITLSYSNRYNSKHPGA